MRAFNNLSQARKRYHESIGVNKSRLPEGHVQVEYPCRALRRTFRTQVAPPAPFLPSTQTLSSVNSAKSASAITESKSPAQKLGSLVHMKSAEQTVDSRNCTDGKGESVRGYESHCSSSGIPRHKLRPRDISTQRTWQKVWPTVVEHNPISSNRTTNEGGSPRDDAQRRDGEGDDAEGDDVQEGKGIGDHRAKSP